MEVPSFATALFFLVPTAFITFILIKKVRKNESFECINIFFLR